jgi:hypothetical protein
MSIKPCLRARPIRESATDGTKNASSSSVNGAPPEA